MNVKKIATYTTCGVVTLAVDGETEVAWAMDMGINPVFRVMGTFMDGMIGPNSELGLANIANVAA